MDEIFDLFEEEAQQHLAGLEKGFLDLETAATTESRSAIIRSVFRNAHSLKGASRAVELPELQDFAQVLEDTLDEMREKPESITPEAVRQGLAQFDLLRDAFEKWQQPEDAVEHVEQAVSPVAPAETADETFNVRVSSDRLDRMLSVAGELRISQRAADLHSQQLADFNDQLSGIPITDLRNLDEVKDKIADQRLEIDNLLVQLQRIRGELHRKQIREELLLKSLEGDIQDARLLPLAGLADSLRRPVRDVAQSTGKSIRYDVDVGSVMLDKAVIEALKDPLLHMIRNAAHHGIETTQERKQAGKPVEGRILVRAQRRGDRVRIDVCDDGRGVNFDRIREKVKQFGELDESEIGDLTEQGLGEFLFKPGFTTASKIDEFSGRGVGLDVVDEAVHRLHGNVRLLPIGEQEPSPESTSLAPGAGKPEFSTIFAITVPVTISTVRILTVICGGQYFGIPGSSIVRTDRVRQDELRELEGSLILTVDGDPVRWVTLADLIGVVSPVSPNGRPMPYLLVSEAGKKLAVGVDDTEDESEVILKPLGFPLAGMAGVIGGTIRPNGAVQAVLDVASSAFRSQRTKPVADILPDKPSARILVVDDSPTTRSIVRGALAADGYSVTTAIDGIDALERLRFQTFDLVVSDVEMPRMNGLELTRLIKSQYSLPVVLVTGMEKEEHRLEGLAAGADAYVVKSSFKDEGLLEIVKQFV